MDKVGLLTLFIALSCGLVDATFDKGVLYPFPINSQLVCHIQNAFRDEPGQPQTVPGLVPRISFGLPEDNLDTDPVSQIWLPAESGFRMPRRAGLDLTKLLNFLGDDFNGALSSVQRPPADNVPIQACNVLPAVEGSAGQQLIHIEEAQDFLALLEPGSPDGGELSLLYNQSVADPSAPDQSDFKDGDFTQIMQIVEQTNSHDELCDIWLGKCPLTPRWVKLPPSYFPTYFAQSTCSAKNCSFPRGLTCQEDFQYVVYTRVLRWDCCYNVLDFGGELRRRWDCGWRKVEVPIFCDCTCGCKEVPSHA